jgi:hypothetical protein
LEGVVPTENSHYPILDNVIVTRNKIRTSHTKLTTDNNTQLQQYVQDVLNGDIIYMCLCYIRMTISYTLKITEQNFNAKIITNAFYHLLVDMKYIESPYYTDKD